MPFTVAGLNQALLADNPTFEKFIRSDLHALVVMLRKTPPAFTASMVAAEMKKISKVKWAKYSRTRAYLEREILMLTSLLRAIPTEFATIRMQSADADAILRHTFKWTSDTGDLADLAHVHTREYVTWPQWPAALTACIGLPHGAEYLHPGFHSGIGTSLANTGQGKDDHATLGVFNQTVLDYTGAQASAPMDQVYQYSYDKVNWFPIANSSYTIVRTVTALPGNHVEVRITKTNTAKPSDTFTVTKTF